LALTAGMNGAPAAAAGAGEMKAYPILDHLTLNRYSLHSRLCCSRR
jgi:hypothetical protein